MNNPRLAIRYAKSLIILAQEQNKLEQVYKDIMFLQGICETNKDFVRILNSPVIQPEKKTKIIEAVTNGRVDILTATFLKLLGRKGRDLNLPEINKAFIEQYNTIKGIKKVKLTTALPVSDEIKKSFIERMTTKGINQVQLETIVDEQIIGGFILESDGKLVDASISRDLHDVKKQFMNNDYIHKLR
ncbi:ATP synthase F1 subunit delta [soil metagenome]